jgi:hypothetical protein
VIVARGISFCNLISLKWVILKEALSIIAPALFYLPASMQASPSVEMTKHELFRGSLKEFA